MARAKATSLNTVGRSIKLVLLSAFFVLAQVMVGYHHVGEEFDHAHAHSHDHAHPLAQTLDHEHNSDQHDFATACDICTVSATLSGAHDLSFTLNAPHPIGKRLPSHAGNDTLGVVARPGGPRAPPQTR